MPRYWHDRHAAAQIDNHEERKFQLSIVADKKPYFMRYIYPVLMRQYNTYISNTNKNSMREFGLTVDELLAVPDGDLTERQREFIHFYRMRLPVGDGDCVMNKICRRFEDEFSGFIKKKDLQDKFDYTILRSDSEYLASHFKAVSDLYNDYERKMRSYVLFCKYEREDITDVQYRYQELKAEYIDACAKVCPNQKSLCNILLDLCYLRSATKRFAWDVCGDDIIENLLDKHDRMISFPTIASNGEISYCGNRFTMKEVKLEVEDEHNFE